MNFKSLLAALPLAAAAIAVAQDGVIPAQPLEDVAWVVEPPARTPAAAESLFDKPAEPMAEAPASGRALLDACAARMPLEPLFMNGTLTMRKAYGVQIKKYGFAVTIQLCAKPTAAKYDE